MTPQPAAGRRGADGRGGADGRARAPLSLYVRPGAVALVTAGGAVGTAARYGLARALPTRAGGWPWGTFVANVVGCLVLGLLLEALLRAGDDTGARRRWRLLAGTGFCGGFTTYSTLAVEADLLVRGHHAGLALGYVAASVVAGALTGVAGVALGAQVRR